MSGFWDLNPKILELYQTDYIRRSKEEYEKINYTAWLQGQYNIAAVQKALFGKKANYPKKPYSQSEDGADDDDGIDIYEKFRRGMRAMNERIKEKDNIPTNQALE